MKLLELKFLNIMINRAGKRIRTMTKVSLTSKFQGKSFKKINKVRCSLIRTITYIVGASREVPRLKLGSRRSGDGTEVEKEWGVWKEVQREGRSSDQKVPRS